MLVMTLLTPTILWNPFLNWPIFIIFQPFTRQSSRWVKNKLEEVHRPWCLAWVLTIVYQGQQVLIIKVLCGNRHYSFPHWHNAKFQYVLKMNFSNKSFLSASTWMVCIFKRCSIRHLIIILYFYDYSSFTERRGWMRLDWLPWQTSQKAG